LRGQIELLRGQMEAKMSKTKKELWEEFERMCDEILPLTARRKPRADRVGLEGKELEEAKRANCAILEIIPGKGGKVGKKWQPYIDRATSYRQVDRTAQDEMWELQRRVGEAARRARMRGDPLNLYGGGAETIDDVVRRQDETR
jgi:hypothetical protein